MKIIFLIFISFSFSSKIISQEKKKIDIKNADFTYINKEKHPDYWRLIGNVNIFHNETNMFSDSAHYYSKVEKIIAFNNIKITKGDSLNLLGDNLNYDGENNLAVISKNVELHSNNAKLTTNKLEYNLQDNIIEYRSRSKIILDDQEIESNKGKYFLKKKSYQFIDSVILKTDTYTINTNNLVSNESDKSQTLNGSSFILFDDKTVYCEKGYLLNNSAEFFKNSYLTTKDYVLIADSIYYNNKNNILKCIGNVCLRDSINNLYIKGNQANFYEKENRMIFKKNPSLFLLSDSDTLIINSDIFENIKNSYSNKIYAYNNVKFNNENLVGKCDSLIYTTNDSTISLFKKPIIWFDEYQVFSDTIFINYFDKKINKLFLNSRPMIISKHDSLNYNQIKGKKMTGFFSKNKLTKIEVKGNGQSIYYLSEDDKTIGMNYLESSNINLNFKKKKIENINYEIIPLSLTKPIKDVKEKDKYLKNFEWRINEKPLF